MANDQSPEQESPAPLGHNNPPVTPETIAADLKDRHAALFARGVDLKTKLETVPDIEDDVAAGKTSELLKAARKLTGNTGELETVRKREKEPHDSAAKAVDATFKREKEALEKASATAATKLEVYLQAKADREKRAREAEAKRLREEADRKAREAAAAEAARAEAERLRIEEERKAEVARLAKEEADRAASKARARARRLQAITPYLRERADREAKRKELAEQERRRLVEEADEAARAAKKRAEDEARSKSKEATAARKEERAATAAAADHEADAEDHADRTEDLFASAQRDEKRAERTDKRAGASPGSMSRTRSDLGAVATLAKVWTFSIDDVGAIPLDELRGYLAEDAVRAAITRFMNDHRSDAGGPKLAGVTFEQVEAARVI